MESSRIVLGNEFQFANTYQDLSIPGFYANKWEQLDYRVYWKGNHNLWVDYVYIYNAQGELAHDLNPDSISAGFSRFNQWINPNNHYRFYPEDEPVPIKYEFHKWFDDHSTLVSPYHPGNAVTVASTEYPWVYASDTRRPELFSDYYPIRSWTDSASEGPNSLQLSLRDFTNAMIPYAMAAKENNINFWMLVQVGSEWNSAGQPTMRDPLVTEIGSQVWLALAYGAKGIGYYLYGSWQDTEGAVRGLVDWNTSTQRYEPNYKWYAVRDINTRLDSLAATLLALSWQGAGVCYNIASVQGSFISSVKSAEFDSAWVEAGFFKDASDANYFMLVNRRCLSTEAQNITISIDSTKTGDNKKMWYVIDQYALDTTFTGAINGSIPFTTHLDPGEGKLFKLVPFSGSAFHGTVHPLTWQGGIMIDGDVTVNWSKTLRIQPPSKITFYANTDGMKTWDTTKCEFFVGGSLQAEGNAIDSIIFTSTVGDTEEWRGIRFFDNANDAILSYCIIENAYIGLDFGEHLDKYKLTNCTLRNNTYGIFHLWLFDLPSMSEVKICDNRIYRDPLLPRGLIGIYVLGGSADLQDVEIEDNFISNYNKGIYLDNCWQPGNLSLGSNNIENVARGLVAEDCIDLQLSHVIVSGDVDEFGFYLEESDVSMSHCEFEGNIIYNTPVGICFYSESSYPRYLLMRYCKITNFSDKGIWCKSHYHPEYVDLGTEQNHGINKIISNSGFLVYNGGPWKGSADTVKAQYNWWGSYPPSPSRFSGKVKYMPALESEPYWPDPENEKLAVFNESSKEIELSHNYPNPFNPITTIQYTVGSQLSTVHTTLRIYNILGQLVKTLVDEEKSEGTYTVFWDGINDKGETVSSGVYFYKLEVGESAEVKKMVLLH